MSHPLIELLPELYAFAWRLEGAAGAEALLTRLWEGPGRKIVSTERADLFGRLRSVHLERRAAGLAMVFPRTPPPSDLAGVEPPPRDQSREWTLADLEEPDRIALLLKEVWSLPHEAIARILDEDEKTTRNRVRRARSEFAVGLAERTGAPPRPQPFPEVPPPCFAIQRRLEGRGLGSDGPLSPEDREHMDGCPSCSHHEETLRLAGEAIRTVPRMRPLPTALRRAMESLLPAGETVPAPEPPPSSRLTPDPFTGAARPALSRPGTLRARRGFPRRSLGYGLLLLGVLGVVALAEMLARRHVPSSSIMDVLLADHRTRIASPQVTLQPDPSLQLPLVGGVEASATWTVAVEGGSVRGASYALSGGAVSLYLLPFMPKNDTVLNDLFSTQHPEPACRAVEGFSACAASLPQGPALALSSLPIDILSSRLPP